MTRLIITIDIPDGSDETTALRHILAEMLKYSDSPLGQSWKVSTDIGWNEDVTAELSRAPKAEKPPDFRPKGSTYRAGTDATQSGPAR